MRWRGAPTRCLVLPGWPGRRPSGGRRKPPWPSMPVQVMASRQACRAHRPDRTNAAGLPMGGRHGRMGQEPTREADPKRQTTRSPTSSRLMTLKVVTSPRVPPTVRRPSGKMAQQRATRRSATRPTWRPGQIAGPTSGKRVVSTFGSMTRSDRRDSRHLSCAQRRKLSRETRESAVIMWRPRQSRDCLTKSAISSMPLKKEVNGPPDSSSCSPYSSPRPMGEAAHRVIPYDSAGVDARQGPLRQGLGGGA